MKDENLDDVIEKKIEEKVENKLEEMAENDVQKNHDSSSELSRREFLKKTGFGMMGIGALAMIPGSSAFNVRTSNPLQYFGQSQDNPDFSVQQMVSWKLSQLM